MAKTVRTRATTAERRMATREVVFTYDLNPTAKEVYLAGDFNRWDPQADPMVKKDGIFRITRSLAPGEHQYKFVVDGQWCVDPAATSQVPNEAGSMNSVIRV
jgi:1,4-alpha-glucan branching enzyme